MADIDKKDMVELSKMKSVDEVDQKLSGSEEIKSEFKAIKEVELMKRKVETMSMTLHAMWLLLKEKGVTNEDLDEAINTVLELEKRKNFKSAIPCPNCGKQMQKMENNPFLFKCFYCGEDSFSNPYRKYDSIDLTAPIPEPKTEEEALAREMEQAQSIINGTYEPYDVSKDLNFEDEDL
ncbi:MAG: hypothetical protein K5745_02030 [Saccharofermentans sp.]|nr:hypothetical protein [Saccharofermentans sp.]